MLVLQVLADRLGDFQIELTSLPGSDYYMETGDMMATDGLEKLKSSMLSILDQLAIQEFQTIFHSGVYVWQYVVSLTSMRMLGQRVYFRGFLALKDASSNDIDGSL